MMNQFATTWGKGLRVNNRIISQRPQGKFGTKDRELVSEFAATTDIGMVGPVLTRPATGNRGSQEQVFVHACYIHI